MNRAKITALYPFIKSAKRTDKRIPLYGQLEFEVVSDLIRLRMNIFRNL